MKQSVLILLLATSAFAQQPASITGFTPESSARERQLEKQFFALPSPESIQKFHRWLTAEPHPAGSERNNQLAREIAEIWKQQGLEDVKIHEYDVLGSYPREVSLEMVSPVKYKAGLREEPFEVDPDTKNPRVRSAYISMSASGEITAPVVYAFSGNPEDYEVLRKQGIDVKGKIVLVRYSNPYSYRGFKALTAQRMGAAAILIYSDPQEDGYKKGKVFPDGPWGPESHIQRGAITYDFIVPGDPLTPGWPSVPGAKQIPQSESQSLPHIMALALSWKDAKPLLENMGGPVAPKKWQGGLPIKYRLGGSGKIHLKIDMDTSVQPNYVVEARIRGEQKPDEWVLFGNHRDAWEFGGVDPSSGTASLLEMTRAFGTLLKQGTRPKRTLVFCSWDGEEVGLTGSTEWGEQFRDELKQKLIAYLNVDSSASGPNFEPTGVASVAPMMVELSKDVQDPSGKPLYEAWKQSAAKSRQKNGDKTPVNDSNLVDVRIGSGSDHTVFLNHIGKPTVGLTFDGPYGVYHSMYDDHYWVSHFGDPGFKYHTVISQYWGALGMRLANSDVSPFDFTGYATKLREFVEEVDRKPGAHKSLEFAGLYSAIADFDAAAKKFASARAAENPSQFDRLNAAANQVELNWLNPDGIPGRPWFKHMLYAARYTYAHLELPGLTEAVEKQDWRTAEQQAKLLEAAIRKNAELLNSASR